MASGKSAKQAATGKASNRKVQGEPKLLSGGHPQIRKGDGTESVRAYLQACPGWKRQVGEGLDALVESLVPDVRRAVRWNSPFWGVEGRGWFLSLHCFTHYVKLTFLNGGQLDPPPPEKSKQPKVRYLNLREGAALDDPQLAEWIRQASGLPGEMLF